MEIAMQTTYSAFDAKTKFSKLLELAGKGKEIVITKHGAPVAKLVPYEDPDRNDIKAAVQRMKEFAKEGYTLGGLSLRALREEGRR
jgi:prevent-host-death family protein